MSRHLRRAIAAAAIGWAIGRTTHWVRHRPAPRPPHPGPGPDDGRGCLTEDEQLDFLAILAVSDLDTSEGSPT